MPLAAHGHHVRCTLRTTLATTCRAEMIICQDHFHERRSHFSATLRTWLHPLHIILGRSAIQDIEKRKSNHLCTRDLNLLCCQRENGADSSLQSPWAAVISHATQGTVSPAIPANLIEVVYHAHNYLLWLSLTNKLTDVVLHFVAEQVHKVAHTRWPATRSRKKTAQKPAIQAAQVGMRVHRACASAALQALHRGAPGQRKKIQDCA
mmetsp:Transcript_45153/g.81666  ORF Transcript_45153/g.81666 Transcript_45153/m.81666 type:complete len:207 (-) Transcript_45153:370-990(-)